MRNRIGTGTALLIIIFLGFLFNYRHLDEFPSHIHAWAQSDRYALSLGFVRNNLNFFRPETFVLNHQFPGDWKVPSGESITAVDFPVHDFIPAVIMKISGIRSPWIFRLYILLYSFAGLFFLFRLSLLLGNGMLKSVFLVLFAATSPVFAYYQGGFLPSIPSLSNAVIGIYFYFRHLQKESSKSFLLAFLFLTLSALSRLPFVIPLAAVTLTEWIRCYRKKGDLKFRVWPAVISFAIVVTYFIYNSWLTKRYGSVFLNHFMPPTGLRDALELVKASLKTWGKDYFTRYHYLAFFAILGASAFFFLASKRRFSRDQKLHLVLIALIFAGSAIFAFLMLKQFPQHDYYFLDTFFLPVILVLAFILVYVPSKVTSDTRITLIVLLTLAGLFLVKKTMLTEDLRRATGYWDRNMTTLHNFEGSSGFLDSLGIGKDARILVADVSSPNIPFILMDRKGYVVMNPDKENLEKALGWGSGYFVAQDDYFIPETYASWPGILSRIERIADNGKIMVCRITDQQENRDLLTFFGLENKEPAFEASMDFDSVSFEKWMNIHPTEKYAHSGSCSGYLAPENEFGLTYKNGDLHELGQQARILVFSAWFRHDTLNNCELVASITKNGRNLYYKTYNLKGQLKKKNAWEQVTFIYPLPGISSKEDELVFYLWNDGKNRLYYDDFVLRFY